MKKGILLILFSLLLIFSTLGQEVEEDDDSVTGPNKLHFLHAYFNTGFMLLPSEGNGADLIYGKSHSISFGIRYKLKIVDYFSIGAGINYTFNGYHLKQNTGKLITDTVLYDKEKILTNNLGGDVFLRFNIGKRKNTIGNYVDLGAYGDWTYNNSRKYYINVDMPGNPKGYEIFITTQKNVVYLEKLNYGFSLRLAYGKYALFGKYRISDMFNQDFKENFSRSEFPRLIVGIELGLHK